MAVRIVTDSASDLGAAVRGEHGIVSVPLSVRFGDEEFADGTLTPQDYWARCAANPLLPETAAPSPGQFQQAFEDAAAGGADGVVCITIASGLSATGQAAQLAADAVADRIPVTVVDSETVSTGEALIVLAAAAAAAAGGSVDDVAGAARDAVGRTRTYAALDTLDNLKKGGRIGGAQALLGSLLSIKPVIEIRHGKVEPESKQRTRARSLRHMVDKVREAGVIERLGVVHGEAPDVEEFLDMLGELHPRADILLSDVGAVIGAHAGPRILGVAIQTPHT